MLFGIHDILVHLGDIFLCLQKVRLWAEEKAQFCSIMPGLLGDSHMERRSESSPLRRDWQRPRKGCPEAEWTAVLGHVFCKETRTVGGWGTMLMWSHSSQWQVCAWHDIRPVPDGSVASHNSILPALTTGTTLRHRLPRRPAEWVRQCSPTFLAPGASVPMRIQSLMI